MKNVIFCSQLSTLLICLLQVVLSICDSREICYQDFIHDKSLCKLRCQSGHFSLPGMNSCHPWLNCSEKIYILAVISISVVKTVYLAEWEGYKVALSVLSSPEFKDDFLHNLYMLKSLSPHNLVVQLLGYCNYSFLSEYHELGSALHIHYHFKHSLKVYDSSKMRFSFCLNYISIIKFLHNSPVGVRVMCDSSTLEKALSQYLVTSDLKLVVNDLDATPLVDPSVGGVYCGKKELTGSFIAPEQVWPFPDEVFNLSKMPFYDEKTDIFKVPDICNWFLGNDSNVDAVKYKLFQIHKKCKNLDPSKRPDASDVLKKYEEILQEVL